MVIRARVAVIVFGTLSIIALIAFVFAFTQQGVAKGNAQIVIETSEKAKRCERLANEQIVMEHQSIEFQKKNEALEQELVRARNSRTK